MNFKHQNAVDLFLRMAQVDSPSFHEHNMVDFLEGLIKELGWNCEIIRQKVYLSKVEPSQRVRFTKEELAAETEQMQVIIPATDPKKAPVFFCAHIDTVEPGRGIKPQFTQGGARIESDKSTILGSDDKSGVAAIICAVDEVIKQKIPHGKLVLLFNALEERGHVGADQIDIKSFAVDYGYVFDTQLRVGRLMERAQHGQVIEAAITVSNIPNHTYAATVPNSLSLAIDLVAKIEKKLFDKEQMTFCQIVKMTSEYAAGYMAPFKTTFKLILRSFDLGHQNKMRDKVLETLDAFKSEGATLNYHIGPKNTIGYNQLQYPGGKALMEKAAGILKEMGIEPEYIRDGLGNHDSSAFIRQGVPALVCSCGMQNIHTTEEFIDVQDLHDCTEFVLRLIKAA